MMSTRLTFLLLLTVIVISTGCRSLLDDNANILEPDNVKSVMDLAKGLEPLYGKFAIYFLGIGLFASGITSSITAPLAAAYVAKSCFGWSGSLKSLNFRIVWFFVLLIGVIVSLLKFNPIEVIKFAQFSNSLLLPIIAILLFWLINNKTIFKNYKI